MKKNLRIVSAAAAALLAVAPVAASAVSANADVTVNNVTATQPAQTAGTVTVNLSLNATAGKTTVAEVKKSIKVSIEGANLANTTKDNYTLQIVKAGTTEALGDDAKLEANQAYQILVNGLKLSGLTTGNTYSIAGGTVSGKTTQTAEELNSESGVNFTSDSFFVFDKSLTGSPVVTEGNHIVSSGKIELGDIKSVSALATAIKHKYNVTVPTGNATAEVWSDSALENSVRAGLKAANVTVDKDGNFNTPATSFTVKVTSYASNGKSIDFPVTVEVKNAPAENVPVFSTSAPSYKQVANSKTAWNLNLDPNSPVNADSIKKDFTAKINSTSDLTTDVKVESSNLNTAVVGKYTVVLSATNPSGKTTKATINVTVGDPGETKTVQAGSETAKVVTIDGNKVTETSNTLTNGSKVATFGTVVVDGVSYTRLNNSNSNQYVETKYVDGSIKEETTKSAKVMYKSAVYDKDGKSTGKTIGGYTDKDFVTTSNGDLKVVEMNGGNFYQLAKGEGYVRVRNVTGSKMTLKHNAYVYKSNGKRANKKVYKKGSTVTVYGGQYKAIKKYKGKAVRIGVNRYIKTANVNYKLAK